MYSVLRDPPDLFVRRYRYTNFFPILFYFFPVPCPYCFPDSLYPTVTHFFPHISTCLLSEKPVFCYFSLIFSIFSKIYPPVAPLHNPCQNPQMSPIFPCVLPHISYSAPCSASRSQGTVPDSIPSCLDLVPCQLLWCNSVTLLLLDLDHVSLTSQYGGHVYRITIQHPRTPDLTPDQY